MILRGFDGTLAMKSSKVMIQEMYDYMGKTYSAKAT